MVPTHKDTGVFSGKLLQKIFDSLSAHIAIIDEQGFILETNAAWKRFSRANGLSETLDFRQMNYLTACEAADGEAARDGQMVASGIGRVMTGEIEEFCHDYPCHSPEGNCWFYMRAVLLADPGPLRVIICHEEITALKEAQQLLKENQDMLEQKNQSLEEINVALKVLIRQRETDKREMEKKFLSNVKTLVSPYINRLKQGRLNEKERTLVQIVDDHLNDIISPLMQTLANANILLTPQEIQVASLVKDGKTTSEIADILFVSQATVNFHRKNLRNKIGITNKQTNLRSFLLSMS